MRRGSHTEQFRIQQDYYAGTADSYDAMHVADDDEHELGLSVLIAYARFCGATSILDVGSGTGRAVRRIKAEAPDVRCVGVEPSAAMRAVGHRRFGLGEDELTDGDALSLDHDSASFDIACAFGVLHHIPTPDRAVAEMLRVARKAVVISDANNFGQGGLVPRGLKQALHALRLWRLADLVKTRGRGYRMSAADGLAYSYSVFDSYPLIAGACRTVHVMNTRGKSVNHYRQAGHVLLIGAK